MPRADGATILEIEELQIGIRGADGGIQPIVGAMSLSIQAGERVALVGESGCGKTLTALACLGITPPPLLVTGGRVLVDGHELAQIPAAGLQQVRGGTVGLVFQEPVGALNPVFSVGFQVVETIRSHGAESRQQARQERDDLFERVGLVPARELSRAYPHQLSGGQLQRAMLAIALAGHPRLLIADEPTTALDLTTQARILELIRSLSEEEGLALLLITHDLAVVAALVERVAVMFAGEVVELAPTRALLAEPLHPYTRELLAAVSRSPSTAGGPSSEMESVPAAAATRARSDGCRFAPRCPLVRTTCRQARQPLQDAGAGHLVRCPVVVARHDR
ncbi:MAG: ABC transporter ATP-binding protein [Acidobacteria bacterium]|nr:ABC transporter ATP-binding protein [Acidobacteriota bacterium]